MQSPALFHVLLDRLEANGTQPVDIQRFVDRWHRLRWYDAFPCPVCYLAGEEQPLAALPAQGSSRSNVQVVGHSSTYQLTGNATSFRNERNDAKRRFARTHRLKCKHARDLGRRLPWPSR
jgi:hypothetical protein